MNPCHALRYLTILLLLVPLVACGDGNSSDDPQDLSGWNVSEDPVEEEEECPGADEGYYYMGSTLEECAAVDYICEAPLQDFANECGCGCVSTSGSEPEPGPEPGPNPGPVCPTEDDGYHYVSTSPAECAAIDFVCELGMEAFENQCGCGCKEFTGVCLYSEESPEYLGHTTEECVAVAEECTEGAYFQDECGCGCQSYEIDPLPIMCPAEEDGYEYVSHDYSECMVIFYSCDEDQQYFEDTDCGCGCYTPPSGGACEPLQPMDAYGDGICDAFFGWTYTGDDGPNNGCYGVSGCDCFGADCGDLFQSLDECMEAATCS